MVLRYLLNTYEHITIGTSNHNAFQPLAIYSFNWNNTDLIIFISYT